MNRSSSERWSCDRRRGDCCRRLSASRPRRQRLAREERQRGGTAAEHSTASTSASGLATSTLRSCSGATGSDSMGSGCRRAGHEEEPDHRGIGDQAQQTRRFKKHERRVAEVEDDGERRASSRRRDTPATLSRTAGRGPSCPRRPAASRTRTRWRRRRRRARRKRAEAARVDLGAAHRGADVAEARVGRIGEHPVVRVRPRPRTRQARRGRQTSASRAAVLLMANDYMLRDKVGHTKNGMPPARRHPVSSWSRRRGYCRTSAASRNRVHRRHAVVARRRSCRGCRSRTRADRSNRRSPGAPRRSRTTTASAAASCRCSRPS